MFLCVFLSVVNFSAHFFPFFISACPLQSGWMRNDREQPQNTRTLSQNSAVTGLHTPIFLALSSVVRVSHDAECCARKPRLEILWAECDVPCLCDCLWWL